MFTSLMQKHIKNQKKDKKSVMLANAESLALDTPRVDIVKNEQREQHISELKTKLHNLEYATGGKKKQPRKRRAPVKMNSD